MLTCLILDKEGKRILISNKSGEIYVYDVSPVFYLLINNNN